jgi:Peptidase S46
MGRARILTLILLLLCAPAFGDGGMWTFDDFPRQLVQREYGADITAAWLERVRRATLRLSNCSASFVSANGLMLTNHHCAEACLDDHSTAGHDLLQEGFLARGRDAELKCSTQIADVLMETEDVTASVLAALAGLNAEAANQARKKILTQLEQACEEHSRHGRFGPLKCESVDLYQGGQYWLYKYHRYDDVRLVFAPEEDIAAFGGDPDNFQFPRWCLDMALLRAYGPDGRPTATPNFLTIRPEGADGGELVFVAGNPGTTGRLLTVARLESLRDVDLPHSLLQASELRGRYIQFGKSGVEAARIVQDPLDSLENSIKVQRNELEALLDERLLQAKREEEAQLRAKVAADPALAAATGDPWSEIAAAQQHEHELYLPYTFLERGAGFNSYLFTYARMLVRAAAERPKSNTARLSEYRDAQLPRLRQILLAPIPVYPQLEQLKLSFGLDRMREWLGPDAPIVRQLLVKDSPDSLAARVVEGSRLADPQLRRQLWDGGAAAIAASQDPMIELARAADAESRAVRKRYEDEVEAPEDAAAEKIARARFRIYGASEPPDATFTLRLNFGTVKGWHEGDRDIEPFTHLARLFERASGYEPFKVPDSWMAARSALDMNTRFNMSTDNDIVGGNSGSPVIDRSGRLVGLVFDGNIHSIVGSYWYDARLNRAVAVDAAIMLEALRKVYRADALLAELGLH